MNSSSPTPHSLEEAAMRLVGNSPQHVHSAPWPSDSPSSSGTQKPTASAVEQPRISGAEGNNLGVENSSGENKSKAGDDEHKPEQKESALRAPEIITPQDKDLPATHASESDNNNRNQDATAASLTTSTVSSGSPVERIVQQQLIRPVVPTVKHECAEQQSAPKPHKNCIPQTATTPKESIPEQEPANLNRIKEVRIQQAVSERTMAKRLGIDIRSLRSLEEPTNDLTVSQLRKIRDALDVPLVDLLEESNELSRPVDERAKMVKVMKTAVALRSTKSNQRISRMATMLCEQLVEVMPELEEVGGWPQFGARRGSSALGKALQQPIDLKSLDISQ